MLILSSGQIIEAVSAKLLLTDPVPGVEKETA
jgi:hypothetical protein